MTLHQILDRLVAAGYENCKIINGAQIIVGTYGEVELMYGEAQIFDRAAPWPGYGDHASFTNIDDLFVDINNTWIKK